jgi:hypothetical protein
MVAGAPQKQRCGSGFAGRGALAILASRARRLSILDLSPMARSQTSAAPIVKGDLGFNAKSGCRPFAFAGLWEPKTIADRETFTIVTTTPNELCIDVHDRMPVLLAPEHWPGWFGTVEQRAGLMRPFPAQGKAQSSGKKDRTGLNDLLNNRLITRAVVGDMVEYEITPLGRLAVDQLLK